MASIREISDRFVDAYAAVDPVRASRAMGVARDASHLTDYSPDGHDAIAELLRGTLTELAAIEPTDEAERLGQAYLQDACRARVTTSRWGSSGCCH